MSCNDCLFQNSCEKATHIENYSLRDCHSCDEFSKFIEANTKIVLLHLFNEIEECMDNRSCTFHSYSKIEPEHLYEGYLETDILNLRKKYLGN